MRPGKLRTFLQVCLCLYIILAIFCPLDHAQQPRSGSTQSVQAKPGAGVSDSSDSSEQKLSGVAVVIKIASTEGDPLFYADGYRIRVLTGTVTSFSGSLKTLADVVPGAWIHFEGVRDDTGVLIARKAEFFSPGSRKGLTAMGPRKAKHAPDYQPVTHDDILDADGHFLGPHAKVRLSDAGGPCGWHRVPADPPLQERVKKIGIQLVPAFQKQLALDDPSRIPFRFYAVDVDKVRSVFACNSGLVLVPKNVVERLHSDDQLAAVLADGIAFSLQRQLVTVSALDLAAAGSEVAAVFLSPAGYIAGETTGIIIDHEIDVRLQRELARIALQLVADAGFDPRQAPEAWRLLAPKELPQDIQSLNYTPEGKYQLSILKLQYKREGSAPPAVLPSSAAGNSLQ